MWLSPRRMQPHILGVLRIVQLHLSPAHAANGILARSSAFRKNRGGKRHILLVAFSVARRSVPAFEEDRSSLLPVKCGQADREGTSTTCLNWQSRGGLSLCCMQRVLPCRVLSCASCSTPNQASSSASLPQDSVRLVEQALALEVLDLRGHRRASRAPEAAAPEAAAGGDPSLPAFARHIRWRVNTGANLSPSLASSKLRLALR